MKPSNTIPNNPPMIECDHISYQYEMYNQNISVLNDFNLSLTQGQTLAIIGSSGSGKSTLLNLLAGIDIPNQGKILLQGAFFSSLSTSERAQFRQKKLGFIYQFHHLLEDFDALDNVAMPLLIQGMNISQAREKANNALTKVGLANRNKHYPNQLSGGQKQRVAVARGFVHQPSIILADEPTGNLDYANATTIIDLLLAQNQQHNTTLIVVTHDKTIAKRFDASINLG